MPPPAPAKRHGAPPPVDSPPTETTASERVNPAWPSTDQQYAATSAVLASSASGISIACAVNPAAVRSSRTASPLARSARGWITATRRTPSPSSPASSPSRLSPMTTSYGVPALTWIRRGSGILEHLGEDLVGDVGRGTTVGQHSVPGHLVVQRAAVVHHLLELAANVAQQQRSRGVEPDLFGCLGEADVEEHHDVLAQVGSGGWVQDRAAAERQHAVAGQRLDHGLALQRTERFVAGVDEDVRDRLARRRL